MNFAFFASSDFAGFSTTIRPLKPSVVSFEPQAGHFSVSVIVLQSLHAFGFGILFFI